MPSISKNVYIDKLDDIVNKYNDRDLRKSKMEPVDVKDNTYIDSTKLRSNKDPKFKVGDQVKICKYKIILLKDTHQVDLKKIFLLKKLKIKFHGYMLLMIKMVKKLLEYFMKKNYKRLINNNLVWKK